MLSIFCNSLKSLYAKKAMNVGIVSASLLVYVCGLIIPIIALFTGAIFSI
ncbi:MAG: hypothetical protein IJ285_03835 [Clostridia bacterium]|nr:hypothetical protein [Clostridia bacterium]